MINRLEVSKLKSEFIKGQPFNHTVIDNFFDEETAISLSREFPSYDSDVWYVYNNPLENKKACNTWNLFPRNLYSTFCYLNSPSFVTKLQKITGIKKLYPDVGLHGGGLHMHGKGGKLNVHLDYSIHPKLKLQRKLNLIVYLAADRKQCITSTDTLFNRAVIFDTTQNSYHGLPTPLECPEGCYRKSIAVYYLTDPVENCPVNSKAIYIPTEEQKDDPEVNRIINKRASMVTVDEVYRV
jgi:hypothetical protein